MTFRDFAPQWPAEFSGGMGEGGNAGQSYAAYLQQFVNAGTLPLWLRLRETTGTNAVNSGSVPLTSTITAATLGQTGQLGLNEAFLFDALTSLITVTLNASLANLTTQRWYFLCKPAGLGENTLGKLFRWGNGTTSFGFASTNRLSVVIDTDTTDATVTTNNNQVDFLTKWATVFMDYDDGNALGLGRRIRLFRGLNGVVSQLTLGTDTAGTGTVVAPAVDLIIGNRANADQTFDGPIDEVAAGPGLWTAQMMTDITRLVGV